MASNGYANSGGNAGRRVLGLDVARGVAVVGMVMVHMVEPVHPVANEPWMLTAVLASPHGRALMLFLAVSGATVAITARWSTKPVCEQRSWLVSRGAVLFVIGAALRPLFESEVLTAYLGYMLLAALLVTLSQRGLFAVGVVLVIVGPSTVWLAETIWPIMRSPEFAGHSVLTWQWLTDTLVFGPYALVRGAGVFVLGMAIGKGGLKRGPQLGRIFAAALIVAAVTLVGQELLESRPYDGVDIRRSLVEAEARPAPDHVVIETVRPTAQLSVAGHSGTIASIIFGSAIAVSILSATLLLSQRFPKLVRWVQPLGRVGLSVYVALALWVGLAPREWRAMPTVGAFEIILFVAVATLASTLWLRRWSNGPLEALTNAASGRSSPVLARVICSHCAQRDHAAEASELARSGRAARTAVAGEN